MSMPLSKQPTPPRPFMSKQPSKKPWAERVAIVATGMVAMAVMAVLAWIVIDVVLHGLGHLSIGYFFSAPENAGRAGGIAPILVSTLLILGVALASAVPIALMTAVFLAHHSRGLSRFAWVVRRSLDALAAVPSIVFGLFGNAFFCHVLGMGFSILSGGLTLACMVLPILILTTEQAIRAVPTDIRHGAAALGLSRATTLFAIELPAAAPALGAGLVLGIGRALAETAALIFTSGYVTRMPGSLLDSGRALSVHVYDLAMNVPNGNGPASAAAAVLILLLLATNAAAVALTRRAAGHALAMHHTERGSAA